jgi:multimeric flavodoxin WrbA
MADRTPIPRDPQNDYTPEMAARRAEFLREKTGVELNHVRRQSFDPAVLPGNIENFLGVAQVPIGVAGPLRVAGISTTVMNRDTPRYSTSERLLGVALDHASFALGAETRLLKLNDLTFRNCEGYYSKSAQSCTWPCTITQADPADQMQQVYEALVFWADVVVLATPIRWGNASSLFYKMAERMNCIQNQITIADRVLIRNKVATFIITGGQDNIQGVAGQLLTFFSEVGFHFPQFPFIAHNRGWDAEDMERNMDAVEKSDDLREGARQLVTRAVGLAGLLLGQGVGVESTPRGGRKASPLRIA